VRYFRVEPDGSLHYFSRAEIDALETVKATKLKETWKAPDFSPAFANVEVQFVPKGQPKATPRIHRHLGANLSDDGFTKAPGLLAHLSAKGRVSAMTKAASYLLWNPAFSVIRDWLVAHAVFMISDSTGVPPRYWKKAGCTVDTFGSFQKSFLGTWEGFQEELRTEFEKAKKLPMRFGYPDGSPEKRSHCVVVKCPDAKKPSRQGAGTSVNKATSGGTPKRTGSTLVPTPVVTKRLRPSSTFRPAA